MANRTMAKASIQDRKDRNRKPTRVLVVTKDAAGKTVRVEVRSVR